MKKLPMLFTFVTVLSLSSGCISIKRETEPATTTTTTTARSTLTPSTTTVERTTTY